MQNNADNKNKIRFFQALSLGSVLGVSIAFPLVLFLLIGLWIDKKLHSSPLFLIGFIFLSFIVVFFDIRNLILPFLEKRSRQNNN